MAEPLTMAPRYAPSVARQLRFRSSLFGYLEVSERWTKRASRKYRRVAYRVVLAVTIALQASIAQSSQTTGATYESSEYQIKAEVIERITRLVTWPSSVFESDSSPFGVCLYGSSPLTRELEHLAVRSRIKNRAARIIRLDSSTTLKDCHLLYVAAVEGAELYGIASRSRGKPILSVGDRPGLASAGLLVNLVVGDEGRIRLELNRDVARDSGLKFSAKLMLLARLVGSAR
jgi:hypothetical protein